MTEGVDGWPLTEPGELVDRTLARLRARGERITVSRRLVIEELAADSGHLSADDLLARVQAREPGVHLATVYRTLDALVQSGVAAHIHLTHGATTYHLVDPGERPHLHVLCRGCDAVLDVAPDTLDSVAAALDSVHGFDLDPEHVALTGRCARCRSD